MSRPSSAPSLGRARPQRTRQDHLLGASNSWFPTALSALSIPRAVDKLSKIVEEQWAELKDTDDIDELRLLRKKQQKGEESVVNVNSG